MTTWTEKLRLKGMAEEDMYFARRDRELIEAMRRRRARKKPPAADGDEKDKPAGR
jgi:hypothetical protein